MNNEERTIIKLNKLLTESLNLIEEALKLGNKKFITGFYLGVSLTGLVAVLDKWYYS